MRKFKCSDCDNTWEIVFFEEKPGVKQACPKCKSLNVQRADIRVVHREKARELIPGNDIGKLKKGRFKRWLAGHNRSNP